MSSYACIDLPQVQTVGTKHYQSPVIDGHVEKKSPTDGGKSPQEKPVKEAADDKEQPVDGSESKKSLGDHSPDQTHDVVDDRDTKPLIDIEESNYDNEVEDKFDKKNTSIIDVPQPDVVDNKHSAPEIDKSDTATDPVLQLQGEKHGE